MEQNYVFWLPTVYRGKVSGSHAWPKEPYICLVSVRIFDIRKTRKWRSVPGVGTVREASAVVPFPPSLCVPIHASGDQTTHTALLGLFESMSPSTV